MKPIISIIISVYNGEKTIIRCIKSIIEQTLKEIEIIIINDGSTDKTSQLLKDMTNRDNRIVVIEKENEGQGIARTLGIKKAKGEYLGFVDADDTINKEMYKIMLTKAKETKADIVQCNINNIFPNGRTMVQLPNINETIKVTNRKKYFAEYIFKPKHSFECCNKLIKRDFLIENNIEFEDNKKVFAEDLLFNLDLALKLNTITFISSPLYNYYQYEDSHSRTKVIEKIDKLCKLFEIFYKRAKGIKYEVSKIAVLIIMLKLSHIIDFDKGREKAKQTLRRPDIRKYLFLSLIKMNRIHHKILMFLLLSMPMRIKLFIIRTYYANLK